MGFRYSQNLELIDVSIIVQVDDKKVCDSWMDAISTLNINSLKGKIDVVEFGGKFFVNDSVTVNKEFINLVTEIEKQVLALKKT